MSDPVQSAPPRRFASPESGYAWEEVDTPSGRCRLVTEPGVYLWGRSRPEPAGIDAFFRDHGIPQSVASHYADRGPGELLAELPARMCYMSYANPRPGGGGAFLANIRAEGHGSVLAHPSYQFVFVGVSRNMTLESNRHHAGVAVSQLSGRFCDPAETGFVCGPLVRDRLGWAADCMAAMRRYGAEYEAARLALCHAAGITPLSAPAASAEGRKLLRRIDKRAREQCRDILPGALETKVCYTMNVRALRNVLEQRVSPDAAWEICRAFGRAFALIAPLDPEHFADYAAAARDDGLSALSTPTRKV